MPNINNRDDKDKAKQLMKRVKVKRETKSLELALAFVGDTNKGSVQSANNGASKISSSLITKEDSVDLPVLESNALGSVCSQEDKEEAGLAFPVTFLYTPIGRSQTVLNQMDTNYWNLPASFEKKAKDPELSSVLKHTDDRSSAIGRSAGLFIFYGSKELLAFGDDKASFTGGVDEASSSTSSNNKVAAASTPAKNKEVGVKKEPGCLRWNDKEETPAVSAKGEAGLDNGLGVSVKEEDGLDVIVKEEWLLPLLNLGVLVKQEEDTTPPNFSSTFNMDLDLRTDQDNNNI